MNITPEQSQNNTIRARSVDAFQKAIHILGSQVEMARQLGIAPELVNRWLKHSKFGVSPRYVIPIEIITKGKVSRFDLRSDLYQLENKLNNA